MLEVMFFKKIGDIDNWLISFQRGKILLQTLNNSIALTLCFISDPMQWSETQVVQWLNWAIHEFTLEGVNVNNFAMRGNELCKMEKEKFLKLAPPFMGDILWEHLDILQKGNNTNIFFFNFVQLLHVQKMVKL